LSRKNNLFLVKCCAYQSINRSMTNL